MHPVRVIRVVDGQEVPYEPLQVPTVDEEQGRAPADRPGGARRLHQPEQEGGPPTRNGVGVGRQARPAAANVATPSDRELRRKLAWAVGTVWGVSYTNYSSWPAEYARLAAARLVEIHGAP